MATGAATETTRRADTHAAADPHLADDAHGHASDGRYITIALILAALTAAETATYFIPAFEANSTLLLLFLMPVMAVKFGMVAWYFMHLKQDSRLFSRLFVAGLVLAVVVYMIVLLAFDEFF
jgi:cytochrome c oxidase subunit IV